MEQKLQNRTRFMPMGVAVRENEDGTESRKIGGKAICFNEAATLWDGKYYVEREVISPSCITEEFLREQDVKLNLMHNRNETVCRCNKGEGTLKLELRADGLYWEAEMPKCDIGDRALELVRNKTLTGCSFEFYPEEYTEAVTQLADGREDTLYTHTKFKALTALTIAMDPAYAGTSVDEREAFEKREKDHETKEAQREAEAKAEAEKREAEKKTREAKIAAMQREVEMMELENL